MDRYNRHKTFGNLYATGLQVEGIKEIDISRMAPEPKYHHTFVEYKSQDYEAGKSGSVNLILIVSRFGTDHALHYLFVANNPSIEQLSNFSKDNYDCWGDDFVVIDTGQRFNTNEEVDEEAKGLKSLLQNVNVYTPAIILR